MVDYSEDSLVKAVEEKINTLRSELVELFQESLDRKTREIIELKTRLIQPEISFEDLAVEVSKLRNVPNNSDEYFLIDHASPVRSLLLSYSEDSRWYWAVNSLNLSPVENSDRILTVLEEYFSKNETVSTDKVSLSNLTDQLVKHAQNEQLGKETIYSWLKIKISQGDIDEMTSNLLANMIDTILDEYAHAQVEQFREECRSEQSCSHEHSLEEVLLKRVIARAESDLNSLN